MNSSTASSMLPNIILAGSKWSREGVRANVQWNDLPHALQKTDLPGSTVTRLVLQNLANFELGVAGKLQVVQINNFFRVGSVASRANRPTEDVIGKQT